MKNPNNKHIMAQATPITMVTGVVGFEFAKSDGLLVGSLRFDLSSVIKDPILNCGSIS